MPFAECQAVAGHCVEAWTALVLLVGIVLIAVAEAGR